MEQKAYVICGQFGSGFQISIFVGPILKISFIVDLLNCYFIESVWAYHKGKLYFKNISFSFE